MKCFAIALAATLAGCAATATRDFEPPKAGAGTWHIEGHEGPFGKLTIAINGQPVLVGDVSFWSGEGQISGSYENHTVVANCTKPRGSDARTQCDVTVDGDRGTTLYFRVKEVLGDHK